MIMYSKYNSRKVAVDGIAFDSVKEARRYKQLKLLQLAGEITDLRMQVPFELVPAQYEGEQKRGSPKEADASKRLSRTTRILFTASTAAGSSRTPRGCAQRTMSSSASSSGGDTVISTTSGRCEHGQNRDALSGAAALCGDPDVLQAAQASAGR